MRILCFGAHPDDIEIGMAGTIAKYVKTGHKIKMVVCMIPDKKDIRLKESTNSAKILGASIEILNLNLDHKILTREMVNIFDKAINGFKPDEIYTHWEHDSHQDHRVITQAVLASARGNLCNVYMYEQIIPGGIVTQAFRAQKIVDISKHINIKRQSLKKHKTQDKKYKKGWIEAIESRAVFWGFMIGTKHAEAFEIVKIVEK